MANKIYIQLNKNILDSYDREVTKGGVIISPLLEDQQIELLTNFQTTSDIIGSTIQNLLDIGTNLQAAGGGTLGVSWVSFTNAFGVPLYKGTEPPKLQVKLAFFTKTSARTDVHDQIRILCSQAILSKNKDNPQVFITPGVSLNSFSDIAKAKKEEDTATTVNNAKFISVWIPGMIYIPKAMIKQAIPTFSRQIVKGDFVGSSSFPLWGTVELSIEGLYPAHEEIFSRKLQTG